MAIVDLTTKTRIGPYEFADRLFELLHERSLHRNKNEWGWAVGDIIEAANREFGFDTGDLGEALTRLVRRRRLYVSTHYDSYYQKYSVKFVLGERKQDRAKAEERGKDRAASNESTP